LPFEYRLILFFKSGHEYTKKCTIGFLYV